MKSSKVSPPTAEPPATLLQPLDPEKMRWEMQPAQLAIARRAFELFEKRNREHGHDWEDWFRAESELLRPVSITTLESADRLSLRANVFGFGEKELAVSIEPKRVVVLGKKEATPTETKAVDSYPDQIMGVIDLPTEVDPAGAVVELQTGVLKLELPKLVETARETAPAAA